MTTIRALAASACLVALVATGCNDSKKDTSSPAPTGAAPSTGATAAPTATGSSSTPDPCTLLTADEVSMAMGFTVSAGVEKDQGAPLGGHECFWSTPTTPIVTFQVVVRGPSDITNGEAPSDLYDQTVTAFTAGDNLKAVSGIGDKAEIGDSQGLVLKGTTYLNTVIGEKGHPQVASALLTLTTAAAAKL